MDSSIRQGNECDQRPLDLSSQLVKQIPSEDKVIERKENRDFICNNDIDISNVKSESEMPLSPCDESNEAVHGVKVENMEQSDTDSIVCDSSADLNRTRDEKMRDEAISSVLSHNACEKDLGDIQVESNPGDSSTDLNSFDDAIISVKSEDTILSNNKLEKDTTFTCNVCMKSLSCMSALNRHLKTHIGEKPFSCEICKKSFNQLSNLKTHIYTHTGEKLFTCNTCVKSFSHVSTLNKHILTHTGEKPFTCEMCNKSFSHLSTLKKHKRIHTGEKPFICNLCERSFTQLATLKYHIRTHTGEKPFTCNICKKSYTESRSLKKHNLRTHAFERNQSILIKDENDLVERSD